jgi:hypothetical protein
VESCDGANLNVSAALRIVVTVSWDERAKTQSAELAMVRM